MNAMQNGLFCSDAFFRSCRKVKIMSIVVDDQRNPHCGTGLKSAHL